MSLKTNQRPAQPDVETDEFDTDEGSYAPPILVQRKSRVAVPPVVPPPTQTASRDTDPGRKRSRWLVSRPARFGLLGVGIVIAVVVVWNQCVMPAWNWSQDQWHYGDARITQLDANVGHGGTSHFIATFSHGNVVVIELMLDHPTTNRIYTLTGFMGGTSTPVVSLSVQDVNHDGKPDLIVQVEGTAFETVLYNTGSGFTTNGGQP